MNGAAGEAIPIYDPRPQYLQLQHALQSAGARVIAGGDYVLNSEVSRFEQAMADYLGVRHAIGVNSGTDALSIALMALDIGPGDEVITSAFSFFGTAEAISRVGATPRFVDIEPGTFNIDPLQVAGAIGKRSRCILPVHLYGQAADMSALHKLARQHGLALVEDVAQACGACHAMQRLGSIGELGAFSFYPTKNLGGFGDGGLVATDDDSLALRCRQLRNHASDGSGIHTVIGFNSRLDALQAALLTEKLPLLDEWNAQRRELARRYHEMLAPLSGIRLPLLRQGSEHVYHQFTLRIIDGRRDKIFQRLRACGVGAMIYYPLPLHWQPPYRKGHMRLPQAELAAAQVLSLPIWPAMAQSTQDRVVAALALALDENEP